MTEVDSQFSTSDLREHLAVMWRNRFTVLAAALLTAAAVYIVLAHRPPEYVAEAAAFVSVRQVDQQSDSTAFKANKLLTVAESRAVIERASQLANPQFNGDDVARKVKLKNGAAVGLIEFTAKADTQEEAATLVDSMLTAMQEEFGSQHSKAIGEEVAGIEDEIKKIQAEIPVSTDSAERLSGLRRQASEARTRPADSLERVVSGTDTAREVQSDPLPAAILAFFAATIIVAEGHVAARVSRRAVPLLGSEAVISALLGGSPVAHAPSGRGNQRASRRWAFFRLAKEIRRHQIVVALDLRSRPNSRGVIDLALLAPSTTEPNILVDYGRADGLLHVALGLPRGPGLAEIGNGKIPVGSALRRLHGMPNAWVLTSGETDGEDVETDIAGLQAIFEYAEYFNKGRVIVCVSMSRVERAEILIRDKHLPVIVVLDPRRCRRVELEVVSALAESAGVEVVGAILEPSASIWSRRRGKRVRAGVATRAPSVADAPA